MKIIDLRSDTVTLPSPTMRDAIFNADLGDDVYGEDPTTNRLEQMASARVGKDAALLVPSGTMGNLICLLTHCGRGDEVILGNLSHTFIYEAGGMAALGGIHPHTVPNQPDGTMLLDDIAGAIRSENVHFPRTRLICLENTHNVCNGTPLTPAYIEAVAGVAAEHGCKLHMDGARIFNAAVALGIDPSKLTCHVDSLIFCLSKGLSAPIGTLVCGSDDFIAEARRARKILGGGMRQCGIISAAGIVSLEEMADRIEEDHEHARRLAAGISEIPGLSIEQERVTTNILYFSLEENRLSAEDLLARCDQSGVKFLPTGNSRFRMVTHYGITQSDIETTLNTLGAIMAAS